jgi:hypothetical protein
MNSSGPLTIPNLLAIWTQSVDESYGQPFLAAGEGNGLEAYTQAFAQYARVSTAIDVTTQACYTLPWSGQTNPPAAGAQLALVSLTFQRSKRLDQPLILSAGTVFYAEQVNDWSESGSVPTLTGIRYTLQQDLCFQPGDMGPLTATAQAENPGYSYNNPLPGDIQVISQSGTQFTNIDATILVQPPATIAPSNTTLFQLNVYNAPDVVIPAHVGQYFELTLGANAGTTIYHGIGYVPPNPPTSGGALTFEVVFTITSATTTGAFQIGEIVQVNNGASVVGYIEFRGGYELGGVFTATYSIRCGATSLGNTLTGLTSKATATVSTFVIAPPTLVNETTDATWVILDWVQDLGLTVTNAASPAGGMFPMLDGIGTDKNLPRQFGELDPTYRARLARIADVVCPNAILRTLNATLGSVPYCFREVGYALLPGFFYDYDFYDNDAQLFTFALSGGGGFFCGEHLHQTQTNPVAVGRALVQQSGAGAYEILSVVVSGTSPPTMTISGSPNFGSIVEVDVNDLSGGNVLNAAKFRWFLNGKVQQVEVLVQLNVPLGDTGLTAQFSNTGPYSSDNKMVATIGFVGQLQGVANILRPNITPFIFGAAVVGQASHSSATPSSVTVPSDIITPTLRYRVYLDYERFRGYFLVNLPVLDWGDFGFFYGAGNGSYGLLNFYDLPGPLNDFYDGFPVTIATLYRNVYNAVDKIRAGGVFWEVYPTDSPCV